MLQNYNKYKLLRQFFIEPTTEFQLRELSRKINLAPLSVKNYLKELEREKLIIIKKHRVHGYPLYKANREDNFKSLKIIDTLFQIKQSNLIDCIDEKILPDTIVLFGSASKGEDIKESDIDLYVQSKEKDLNLAKYEELIKRKVNIIFSENFNKLSKELKNNIINGIMLKGYLKVF